MAINFREMSLPVQALLFAVLAVVLIGVGLYAPFSPVKQKDAELEKLQTTARDLISQKTSLEVYRKRLPELQSAIQGVQNEIDNLRKIIPADKDADEFIRLMQGAAASSNVSIRRLKALSVAARDQYYEMPFEVEVDGPYYAVSEFFSRLSKVSRIINVGDLNLKSTAEGAGRKYPLRPGTSVSGSFVAMTFFTRAAEEPAAKQPAAPPAKR
ncbi:MAG: type 4a pilus biogenesis protein PilO [Acidobacteria bacterium]|nr:type 4a pilus biogenesis protein PilO [Acidobacteriota bacterium]MBI3662859.1 type 4a pilus biogenesis protein PilO [Acidobacteriota bacterium]